MKQQRIDGPAEELGKQTPVEEIKTLMKALADEGHPVVLSREVSPDAEYVLTFKNPGTEILRTFDRPHIAPALRAMLALLDHIHEQEK